MSGRGGEVSEESVGEWDTSGGSRGEKEGLLGLKRVRSPSHLHPIPVLSYHSEPKPKSSPWGSSHWPWS